MINRFLAIHCLIICMPFTVFILSGFAPVAMSTKKYALLSDTSSFSPNTNAGWGRMSFYLNQQTTDSADFEIVFTKNNVIQGSSELLTGTITNPAFVPLSEQQVNYRLLTGNSWRIRITTSGKCYIKQTEGQSVPGNPSILPVKIRYKNK